MSARGDAPEGDGASERAVERSQARGGERAGQPAGATGVGGPEPVLILEGIRKTYQESAGPLEVLRSVGLSLRPGEVVVLQGPSGSGKTTLLQIGGCLLRADEGRVILKGMELSDAPESARVLARRRHLGFIFQQFHLLPALSVEDNVALGLRFKGLEASPSRVLGLLETLGIASKRRKLPRHLSGGEKQRTAIARALVGHPDVLLADEPTSQLDAASAELVCGLLAARVRELGVGAIITTHDPRLHRVADRVLRLENGSLSGGGTGPGV